MDPKVQEAVNLLISKGAFLVRNGSVEMFLDDVGEIQKICYRLRRRRRAGETFAILPVINGKAVGHYGKDHELLQVDYETEWTRKNDPDYPLHP